MAFEKTVPLWGAPGTEPPESLKASGFEPGYKPPAAFFNWFWYNVSQCLAELQGMSPDDIGAAMKDLSNIPAELFKQKCEAAGLSGSLPIVAATSTDGIAYSATVEDVAALTNGMMVTIIPDMDSASTAVTLDVNGLGAKYIKIPLSTSTGTLTAPRLAGYFMAGRPVVLQYDAGYAGGGAWKTVDKQRPDANDIYGTVAVERGGTDSSTPDGARANLQAQKQVTYSTTDLTAGESALPEGEVYLVYE